MLNTILSNPVTLPGLLICLAAAMVLGLLTSIVFSYKGRHSAGFALTLALLPMAVTVVIMLVNGNVGAGVAVAGAFALVRFRSVPGTAKEIAAIFIAMTLGLALGMGYVGIAVLFFVCAACFTLLLTRFDFGAPPKQEKQVRITIPENYDYEGLFDDIFETYELKAELGKIRTAGMGTLIELTYYIRFPEGVVKKAFLDDVRTRNGNLDIHVSSLEEREGM